MVAPTFQGASGSHLPRAGVAIAACVVSMVSITLGTIWQKRTAATADLRTNLALQFLGAFLVTVPFAVATENMRFDLASAALAGLLWSVLGNSVGSTGLLMLLIRRGEVAAVASLFYLVPAVSAVMAYTIFGDALVPMQMAGMALAVIGVAVANRKRRADLPAGNA